VSCYNNVRLHTSVANSMRWAPHYGAQYTVIYVFRAGTRSGKASAPTLVLLSVRQTFPDRSRVHGAEGQFTCVCGVGVLNSQSCHANIRPVTSYFGRKQPALGPALRRTVHSRLRLQSWYTQRQSQRTNICVLVFRQTFPDRSRVHGAEDSSPVCKELPHSSAKAVTPTSVRSFLTSIPNLPNLTPQL
jgi:hypothetical protein